MKRYFVATCWVLMLIHLGLVSLFSYPGGITGRTQKSGTTGCASCHSQNTNFVVTISGPSSLTAGATGTYSVTMSGTKTGVNIAASNGTLTPGSNLQVVGDELTHKNATNPGSFPFTYTAPATAGTITLYATGANTTSTWNFAPNFVINVTSVTGVKEQATHFIPDQVQIIQNYPNPFNPTTTISFFLPSSRKTTLTIFDITGKKIAMLVDGIVPAGANSIHFDGSKLSSGIYFYRLQTPQTSEVRSMVLIK